MGPIKEATKKLAHRAYAEWLKIVKWRGKSFVPCLCRIDIGVVPDKSKPYGVRTFVNEIEQECTTYLVRYCPFNLLEHMGAVYVKKAHELLSRSLEAGDKITNAVRVKELLEVLGERLGQQNSKTTKRKRGDEVDNGKGKKARVGGA